MKRAVHSILFRKLTLSNAGMFLGRNRGEYDLRFGKVRDIDAFTDHIPTGNQTDLGGWTKSIPVSAFDGDPEVPPATLRLRFMGPNGARANDVYIAGQSSTPYPLWAPPRTRPGSAAPEDFVGDVALLVMDVYGDYHARYVRKDVIHHLPAALQACITTQEKGVWTVPTATHSTPSPQVQRIIDALRTHHNVLLYGPPGTGKTHLVTEVRSHFGQPSGAVSIDTSVETEAVTDFAEAVRKVHSEWTTFHQSYSYEDFLIGLRPDPQAGGGFDLVARPGILLELAEWARKPDHESLLIIDEINRGNVSRIFGEFITLIEPDKRLGVDGNPTSTTVTVRLPFVDPKKAVTVNLPDDTEAIVVAPFRMPNAVYTLATMNSVDKSVAPLDAALRRRFHVVSVFPDLEGFASRLGISPARWTKTDVEAHPSTLADVRIVAVALLTVLNQRVSLFLGPDHQFGEWFLAPLLAETSGEEALAALAEIWRTKLMPQLEEYFVGRADQFAKVLGDLKKHPALIVDNPPADYAELGAVQAIRANPHALDDDVIALASQIAKGGLPAPTTQPTQMPNELTDSQTDDLPRADAE